MASKIRKLLQQIQYDGGATLGHQEVKDYAYSKDLKEYYAVGIGEEIVNYSLREDLPLDEQILDFPYSDSYLLGYIKALLDVDPLRYDHKGRPDMTIGFWIDGDYNLIIEKVLLVDNRPAAMMLGSMHNQYSIFDLVNDLEEIV